MSRSIHPDDLAFFSTLVRSGSLSAAARELGVSTAAVSKRLTQMEARLGLGLINRTTRRMSLTPEGETYLEHARRILAELEDLEHLLLGSQVEPQGLLRVNATLGFGRSRIAPLLSAFVRRYPRVDIQLQLSVNPPPIAEDAFDVCFRFGPPPDSRAIARFVAPNRRILVASPSYLKKHGEPRTPHDLVRHNCIGIRQGDEPYGVWRFVHARRKEHGEAIESVKIRGNLTTNDGEVAVNWALDGHGIVLRAEWDVTRYLRSGRLVQVLAGYSTSDADIYAVYPQRHKSSTRVRALVDFVSAALGRKAT